MKLHLIVLDFCLCVSIGCLGIAYILRGFWLIVPVILVMAIFWITSRKKSAFWSASAILLIYVALAVIGVLIDLSTAMMLLGCTSALAFWDLAHFRQSMGNIPPNESQVRLERDRLQSLAASVFTGLLMASLSSLISLQLQFGAIVFLALLAVGCLTYGLRYSRRAD